ncbi:MAG: hypothetical protein J1E60_05765 [Christensenellaceae bacterium]|nr:hypothetical protein [Christensenellaceae bacterium]
MLTVCSYFKYEGRDDYAERMAHIESYALAHGYDIAHRFCDRFGSNAVCFSELIGAVESGAIEITRLIVPDKQSLGDNDLMFEENYYSLMACGIKLSIVSGERPIGFIQHCLNAIKEYNTVGIDWSIRLGERTAPEPHRITKSNLPYGYRIVNGFPQADEEQCRLISDAFDLYCSGSSTAGVAEELSRRSSDGKSFTRTNALSIISNPRYSGVDKGVRGAIPALVTNRMWLIADGIRQKNSTSEVFEYDNIFSDIMVYASIRNRKGIERTKPSFTYIYDERMNRVPSYVFITERETFYIDAEKLESLVIAAMRDWACVNAERCKELIFEYAKTKTVELPNLIDSLKNELSELQQSISQSNGFLVNDTTGARTARFDEIKHKYIETKRSIHRAEVNYQQCAQSKEAIEFFFERLKHLDELGNAEKRFMLNHSIMSVRIRPQDTIVSIYFDEKAKLPPIPIGMKKQQ